MLPASSRFVVVGAGMHGLSTAYHLAVELRRRGQRLRRGRDRAREVRARRGRDGDRLRRRPQQLLPARDERADAGVRRGVGVRPRGVPLQRRRLHRTRAAGAGERPHRRLRAPPADRLSLRPVPRRGRGRRAHEGALPRLARAGRHRVPARAPGRLRVQPRVGRGPPRQVPRRGRRDPLPHRGDGIRARRRRQRHGRRDRQGPHRGRRAARDRPRPLGEALLGAARAPADDRHPHPFGRRRPRPAHVDLLEPAGGRDHGRPADVRHRGRRRAAGDPPRHGRAAAHATTAR